MAELVIGPIYRRDLIASFGLQISNGASNELTPGVHAGKSKASEYKHGVNLT